jgi:hypothetical protein
VEATPPRQRFRILLFMKTYVMSIAETCPAALVAPDGPGLSPRRVRSAGDRSAR